MPWKTETTIGASKCLPKKQRVYETKQKFTDKVSSCPPWRDFHLCIESDVIQIYKLAFMILNPNYFFTFCRPLIFMYKKMAKLYKFDLEIVQPNWNITAEFPLQWLQFKVLEEVLILKKVDDIGIKNLFITVCDY